ncbi:unnamed protein product [Gongylonema pulchrum]|uniref:Secreted protein n=1 Tax=Gongylonema pulchrum TaxID=637853 RepID=A0A183E9C8_9BILA|nr:unnamed protein product [Gongylonema pulchrum]
MSSVLFKCALLGVMLHMAHSAAISSFNGNRAGDAAFNDNANSINSMKRIKGAQESFNSNASMNNNANDHGVSDDIAVAAPVPPVPPVPALPPVPPTGNAGAAGASDSFNVNLAGNEVSSITYLFSRFDCASDGTHKE